MLSLCGGRVEEGGFLILEFKIPGCSELVGRRGKEGKKISRDDFSVSGVRQFTNVHRVMVVATCQNLLMKMTASTKLDSADGDASCSCRCCKYASTSAAVKENGEMLKNLVNQCVNLITELILSVAFGSSCFGSSVR